MRARFSPAKFRMGKAAEDAHAEVQRQGLDLPDKPDDSIPTLPSDLTALDDTMLMTLWTTLTGWGEYLAVQVACARTDERAAERAVEAAQAKVMIDNWTGKATERVAIAKARFLVDPEAKALVDEQETLHAYRSLVETLANNVEKNTALVSRELTRRTSGVSVSRKGWGTP